MVSLSEKAQKDLFSILKLQKNIRGIGAGSTAQWEPSTQNLLKEVSEFVKEHAPTSFTLSVDDNGNPNVSFTWST